MPKAILIVDDEQMTRRLVSYVLQGAGCSVVEGENGQQALEKLGGSSFDLIITDLNMPGMDGIELIREVRKRPEHKSTPILMLSMESDGDKKKQGKQAGATGWIVKPFTPAKLLELVSKILGVKLAGGVGSIKKN